ncbi:MAG: chromosome partitioning protein [Comamonadaceae bacterium PBBC1]|nr:MAG: chromosome partitioning protein [Comamonadaceae bacterium PBBC1]
MTRPVFTFFNVNEGAGKTRLIYHIAHMFAIMGVHVLAVDCDPQAKLSASFLRDEALQALWDDASCAQTIYRAVQPLTGNGDYVTPKLQEITPKLHLIAGDLGLSSFEDQLSEQWSNANSDNSDTYGQSFDILTAFWRCAQEAASQCEADIIIFDIGPNLGAINRSVLLGTDHVIVPLGADLFSLRGLQNIGPALRVWRKSWETRSAKPFNDYTLPKGDMHVLGYVAMQHQVRLSRPVQAYKQWVDQIPSDYRKYIEETTTDNTPKIEDDPFALALLRHYKSIVPIGQEARKPIFSLKSADGVSGSQMATVRAAYDDFQNLATKILLQANLAHLL